ncbi:MAG: S4 domain-containing protein YaaA [Limnochordales bacterium]|nr:S4 domain-containing protein YaaA [Limnochordales bacterium]
MRESSGKSEAKQTSVAIRGGWITLGQFLKRLAYIRTGGAAKAWLQENQVLVNGEPETRRGRKLRPGDTVQIGEESYVCVDADVATDEETPPGV